MLFLLFIGVCLCLWITGIIIAIACGLPLLALIVKIAIEMFVGYKVFTAIKRKREHEVNQFKGLM